MVARQTEFPYNVVLNFELFIEKTRHNQKGD